MKKLGLPFLLVFITTNFLFATHNQAGEIIFKQIDALTIEASVITYTLASSIAADRDSLTICWEVGVCEIIGRTNGNGDGELISGDTKKNIYTKTHTYPSIGYYEITMMDPNRNGGILNVDWPNSENTLFSLKTTFTFLNPNFSGPNNSPILLQAPIDIAFVNEPFYHTPNAFDVDGDSIAYELITPLGVSDYEEITQIGPGPNNNLEMNAETGLLVWDAPQVEGTYTIAYLIKSYRNGEIIDEVIRDMQIEVEDGFGFAPEIVMENVIGNEEIILVDLGDTVTLNVLITDFDVNQELEISASCGLFDTFSSNAIFNASTNGNESSGTFEWVVKSEHLRQQPYSLVFRAEDNAGSHHKSKIAVVRYKTSTTTSLNEVAKAHDFKLYPNPVRDGYLSFFFSQEWIDYKSYKILNILGHEVSQGKINSDLTEISTIGLLKGTYVLLVENGKEPMTMTFVVK